jgi:hypothetical protein
MGVSKSINGTEKQIDDRDFIRIWLANFIMGKAGENPAREGRSRRMIGPSDWTSEIGKLLFSIAEACSALTWIVPGQCILDSLEAHACRHRYNGISCLSSTSEGAVNPLCRTGWFVSMLIGSCGCIAALGCRPQAKSGPVPRIATSESSMAMAPGKPPIRGRFRVAELPFDIVVFDTVFWEPRDTKSLRTLIHETDLVRKRTVLEIGTGSGLVALCCLYAEATRVVATVVNPNALQNARYNAEMLELLDRLETRRVPLENSTAFAVL